MLSIRTVLNRDGVAIKDVTCRHPVGRGDAIEPATERQLVFVRRGCFTRAAAEGESLLDPTVAYCVNPGEEQRFDHPHAAGDACTALSLDATLTASIWGGDQMLPSGTLPMPPAVDLEHRLMLVAARRGADSEALIERAIMLAATALERIDPAPVASGRPGTVRAQRALVNGARELLAAEPDCPLPSLARRLAVSPHHLSRIFRAATGHTISRHRMRLRARTALERLAGGERDLARLAAELGFADQSHLNHVLRAETDRTPGELRNALTAPTIREQAVRGRRVAD